MKKKNSLPKIRLSKLKSFIILFVIVLIQGCAIMLGLHGGFENEKSEVGATIGIGQLSVNDKWHLNGVAGLNTFLLKDDTDTYVELGIQGRRTAASSNFWYGGEINYINDIRHAEYGVWDSDPNAHGFSIGTFGAYQLPVKSLSVSIIPKMSYVGYLDSKGNEEIVKYNSSGFRFLLGLELALPFQN